MAATPKFWAKNGEEIAGAVLNLISGVFRNGSAPEKFARHAQNFAQNELPKINQIQDISQRLTETSKALSYMLMMYRAHLKYSKSERSKTGNSAGLKAIEELIEEFNVYVQSLSQEYNISTRALKFNFPNGYVQGAVFHDPKNLKRTTTYTRFTAVPKKKSSATTKGSNTNSPFSNDTPVQNQQASFTPTVIVMLIVAGFMFLFNKTKK